MQNIGANIYVNRKSTSTDSLIFTGPSPIIDIAYRD